MLHGKRLIDGFGGLLKWFLRKELRGNVTNQHETIVDKKNMIVYVEYDEQGNKFDAARVAAKIWNGRTLGGKGPSKPA